MSLDFLNSFRPILTLSYVAKSYNCKFYTLNVTF